MLSVLFFTFLAVSVHNPFNTLVNVMPVVEIKTKSRHSCHDAVNVDALLSLRACNLSSTSKREINTVIQITETFLNSFKFFITHKIMIDSRHSKIKLLIQVIQLHSNILYRWHNNPQHYFYLVLLFECYQDTSSGIQSSTMAFRSSTVTTTTTIENNHSNNKQQLKTI